MNLLLLTPEYDGVGGGIATFYRMLAPALCALGVKIRVIEGSGVHATKSRAEHIRDGIHIETLEVERLLRWTERFAGYAATPGLRRHIAAAWAMWEQADYGVGSDVVEAVDWGLLFVPAAIEATHPLVVQCHGSIGQVADHEPMAGEATENLLCRLVEKSVLSIAGVVQTSSQSNAAFWRAEAGRDVETICPAWAARVVSVPEEPSNHGLVVGRLQRWKGPGLLCEALRRLGPVAPRVDWVGRDTVWDARDGSTAKHLARIYPDIWKSKFFHQAPITPVEVARRQARALFNIVPSTWDVFNFTTVEAMASGRPVIVSTGAGASELITDEVNGYLFANDDPEALAEVIERVLGESPARLTEVGREAQSTVRAALNPKAIAIQRLAAYRGAIDAFNARRPTGVGGWLGAICRPSEMSGGDMTFLDHFPLSGLAKHVVERASRRLRPR